MPWWTELDSAYDDVHAARAAVDKAQREYSRCKGVEALNSANSRCCPTLMIGSVK